MAVLALVSAAILTVPSWIWADCCCLSDSPEVATTVEQSSCCHTAKVAKTVAPSSRLPRVKTSCECEARVGTWHATIPQRQVLPELGGIASISSEADSTFSARDFPTGPSGTEVVGRSGPRLYVLLCHWLA
jgi:hypothetical protein